MECPNGGFRPCEGHGLARISGLLVDSLIMLARRVLCRFCYISASTALKSRVWTPIVVCLHFEAYFLPSPPPPSLHPPASTPQPPPPSLHPPASTPQPPPPSLHPPASTPQPPPPSLHPFVSTRDTTSLVQLLRFSILFGGKLYKQLQVLEVT